MNKFYEHEDYNDYYEFGPDEVEIPQECEVCACCGHCDTGNAREFYDYFGEVRTSAPCMAYASRQVDLEAPKCGKFLIADQVYEQLRRDAADNRPHA